MEAKNIKVAITGGRPSEMLFYNNGQPIGPIKDITLEPTFSFDSEGNARILRVDLVRDTGFTATFTPEFPHISKKRFIRNLIKAGCPKKKAKEIAWKVQKGGRKSYGYANFLARTVGWWNVW